MTKRQTGEYITVSTVGNEKVQAFIPSPLPPDPPVEIDDDLREAIDNALLALGRLDSVRTLLPDASLFLYMFVRKEAVLSSQIEGTQSSLSDLLLYESKFAPGVPLDDVTEVSQYVKALEHGLARIRSGFPLSLRLIREIHQILLSHGRGSEKDPGEFRRTQNWIGGDRPGNAIFVPPPPNMLLDCMGALEKFIHNIPVRTPSLIKAALVHVQFETIHPFLDGNGRVGRLLIPLLLCSETVLYEPMLYLSLYFKSNRYEYYEKLLKVRTDGDWEGWIRFFIAGVTTIAIQAVMTALALKGLIETDREIIQDQFGRSGSALHIHHVLGEYPIRTIKTIAEKTGLANPTVSTHLKKLCEIGIMEEITGRARDRVYVYSEYLKILSEGTEPIR